MRDNPYNDYTYNAIASQIHIDYRKASQILSARAHDPKSGVYGFTRHRLPKGATKPAAGTTLGGKMTTVALYTWSPWRKRVLAGDITMQVAVREAIVQVLTDYPGLSHRQLYERVRRLLGTVDRTAVEERVRSGIAKGVLLAVPGPRGAELLRLAK